MEILINNFSEIESIKDSLTFGKVKFLYGTGRSNTFTTVHGKVTTYRCGVMTEIGDIEESVWMQIVEFLIKKSHEIELYHNLLEWVKERSKWCVRVRRNARSMHFGFMLQEFLIIKSGLITEHLMRSIVLILSQIN